MPIKWFWFALWISLLSPAAGLAADDPSCRGLFQPDFLLTHQPHSDYQGIAPVYLEGFLPYVGHYKLRTPHTVQETLDVLDHYFREVIKVYPEETQQLLNEIYFEGKHTKVVKNMIETGNFANWSVSGPIFDFDSYRFEIDADVKRSPILLRLNKIHEVAGHIGQVHSRALQVGGVQFLAEFQSGELRRFLELSAALVEKKIIDVLDMEILDREFHSSIRSRRVADLAYQSYQYRRHFPVRYYLMLGHREPHKRVGLTMEECMAFRARVTQLGESL